MFLVAWIVTAAQAAAPKPEMKYVGALWQDGKGYYFGPAPCLDQAMAALEIALTQVQEKKIDRSAALDDAVCRARECADLERQIRPEPEESVPGTVPEKKP
jgi:hypothetical protein